jgi:O-methyltransferase
MSRIVSKVSNKLRYMVDVELKSRGYFRDIWYPRYEFQMSPRQLCFLAQCIERIKEVDGAIVEIGCAHGLTTTFLHEYMTGSGFEKEYVCIDTFAGFTEKDINVEVNERDKKTSDYKGAFTDNDPTWFKESLQKRNINNIKIIQADISELSKEMLPERVAFCLVDVDLYRPVLSALEKIYPRMSPGGLIVIDDCWHKASPSFVPVDIAEVFDGAMQAYQEFAANHDLPEILVEEKLGVIELA